MEYKHINDCWNAIRKATTYDELEDVIWEFPRWSGDWEIVRNSENYCRVINIYYDEQCETWDEDEEDTDIPYDDEEVFKDE